MRKSFLVAVATIAAVTMLTACGNNNNGDTTPTPTPTTQATPTNPDRGDGPSTPAPTQGAEATPAPTVDHKQMVNNIHQAVQEAYGSFYAPSMQMQADEFYMADTLKLDASWYDEAIVEVMGMAVIPDTFIIIHPTEGNLENVKNAMEAYKTTLTENAWYPTTVTRSQGAQTGVVGEYVYFVVLTSSVNDMEYTDEAALIAACKENTQLAVDTITGVVNGDIVVTPWTETQKIRAAIMKAYADKYFPNVQVQDDPAYMQELLKLDASWYDEAVVEIPMIGANADKLILIHATEGNLENVKAALEAHKQSLIEDSMQYPMNKPRVQTAWVVTVGDYAIFSILGGAVDNPEEMGIYSDEDLLMYYESQNSNAEWAVRGYLGIWE
ncbi:MAG: DUF4358 domain-containing protein [Lachnospiraceae bacterium]|nr:DUF4358 domain-containing protein [Lachnospiraceae bacterium]